MRVLVARIGKAHGLRGEVTVQVHTDAPQERFTPGTRFLTEPAGAGPLTLRSARDQAGTTVLGFEEAVDRTAAEGLRGIRLFLDVAGTPATGEPEEDAWYEDDLVGLAVHTLDGTRVGTVSALESRPAQDLLVLALPGGREARVPFVQALVPEVDVAGGRVVIDPPPGLLDLDQA